PGPPVARALRADGAVAEAGDAVQRRARGGYESGPPLDAPGAERPVRSAHDPAESRNALVADERTCLAAGERGERDLDRHGAHVDDRGARRVDRDPLAAHGLRHA